MYEKESLDIGTISKLKLIRLFFVILYILLEVKSNVYTVSL